MPNPLDALIAISTAPADEAAFAAWLAGADAIAFLNANVAAKEFVLYATLNHTYLNTIVIPGRQVARASSKRLVEWDLSAFTSWGIVHSYRPESVAIAPPIDRPRNRVYRNAEQLVFARTFDGRIGEKTYFEFLQKFCHIFDLHFLEERNAYCRLDERGDIEDVIRIERIADKDSRGLVTLLTCLPRYARRICDADGVRSRPGL
jgi:hypothetical protein